MIQGWQRRYVCSNEHILGFNSEFERICTKCADPERNWRQKTLRWVNTGRWFNLLSWGDGYWQEYELKAVVEGT